MDPKATMRKGGTMMRRRGVLVILAGALIGSAILAAAPARPVNRVVLCETGAGCDGSDIRFQLQSAAPIPADVDFGFSTAMGYLDGDRLADMVVGAPGENRVYIFFGGVDNASPGQTLADRALDATAADVVIAGNPNTQFGFSVAIALLLRLGIITIFISSIDDFMIDCRYWWWRLRGKHDWRRDPNLPELK